MLTRRELKQHAKEQLRGKVGILFLCGVIYLAISLGISIIPVISFIGVFVLIPPIELGLTKVYMDITYGKPAQVATLFSGFSQFGQSILTYLLLIGLSLLVSILTLLPFIVLLVLGIEVDSIGMVYGAAVWYFVAIIFLYYFALGFSFIFYIMAEEPELSALDIVKTSWRMIKGHRWDYIILTLSFLPWILLGAVTLGIAMIWVAPYIQLTFINFYHNLKGDLPDFQDSYRDETYSEYYESYEASPEVPTYANDVVENPIVVEEAAEEVAFESEEEIIPVSKEETALISEDEIARETDDSDEDEEWSWDNL